MPFIQIQLRKGTSTEWSSANPTLAIAEVGVETNTGLFKIGNGSSNWNSLPYSSTNWSSLIGTPVGLVSSSLQIGTVSGSFTGSLLGTSSLATTASFAISASYVSGAASTWDTITNKPTGLVSSSTQVNYTALQNIPSGIVSSSSQINTGSFSGSFTGSMLGTSSWANNSISSSIAGNAVLLNNINSATFARTGSNTFSGIQVIADSTNSTAFNNGALIISGGVGIAKDVNISGSLTINGLLTAISMSTQYVTSSEYTIGVSRIILNDDDLVRFAGISIVDSGSTNATASILWDSVNHKFLYEAAGVQSYSGGILIAGPRNTGALGDERTLISGRVPVSVGGDHIDTAPQSSSIRVDFSNLRTHVENGLTVTGSINATSVTASVLGTATSASYVTFSDIANIPTLFSASSQVVYSGISNIPVGLLSSSAQINVLSNISASYASSSDLLNGKPYTVFATTGSNIYTGTQTISGSVISTEGMTAYGNMLIQNGTFTKYILQNDSLVTGSLATTNASIWVGSESSHEVAIIIAGSPAFKVNTTSNFVPANNGLQDIGADAERIRTLWVTNISSSTAVPSAIFAETASYVPNISSGETFSPFLLAGM